VIFDRWLDYRLIVSGWCGDAINHVHGVVYFTFMELKYWFLVM